jgi:acetylcholinesterase
MNQPTVTVKQGKLVGTVSKDIDGNNFYSFKGIPYATPPLGKLRFKAPLPPSPWTGVLQATKDGNCCYSKDLFTKKIVGSEDCLNLNVYTPRVSRKFEN